MKINIALSSLGLFFLSLSANAQGNFVFNGDFDSSAGGWVTNASSGYYNPAKGNPGGCFDLSGSISQTISSLSPGASYMISGSYNVAGGTLTSTPSFGVTLDGKILFEVAPQDYGWHTFSFFYTPTSSSALLSLDAQIQGVGLGYRVDNISIQAIPEPNVFSLVGMSVVCLCWRQMRLRSNRGAAARRPFELRGNS